MALRSLEDCFQDELRDILSAEKQLVKALPKMAKGAESEELRAAIEEHLEETKGQVERLEKVFESIGKSARAKKCEAMEGLLEEGEELLEEDAEEGVLDAMIIAAAQKVEHYEIATYGTLCTWAKLLGHDDALQLLKENLAEEKTADEKLTQIASEVNVEAMEPVEAE
jgi:ferritin-like metal-binding protein YciE